jgi:hypothetical protein
VETPSVGRSPTPTTKNSSRALCSCGTAVCHLRCVCTCNRSVCRWVFVHVTSGHLRAVGLHIAEGVTIRSIT